MSSSSTVGIVSSLLADLLRTFGYSSISFLLKSSHYFMVFGECFLLVCILFLRRRALSLVFWYFRGFTDVLLFVWDLQRLFSPLSFP